MKIWLLFSIANLKDQPHNNVVAWFYHKPSEIILREIISDLTLDDNQISALRKGYQIQSKGLGTNYRLSHVEEGLLKGVG